MTLEALLSSALRHQVLILLLLYAVALLIFILWCALSLCCCCKRLRKALGAVACLLLFIALALTAYLIPLARTVAATSFRLAETALINEMANNIN